MNYYICKHINIMKTRDENGVKDHMAEMFKFAIVRHIDKLNQKRKSFTQEYGLDESNGLYLDNYVEFVYTKVNSMVSQYEENKNSETVEEIKNSGDKKIYYIEIKFVIQK